MPEREVYARDPLAAPSMRARTAEIAAELARLRMQVLFLFALIVAALIILSIVFQRQQTQFQVDRWISCTQRLSDIQLYNSQNPQQPPQPLPTCPPDPR